MGIMGIAKAIDRLRGHGRTDKQVAETVTLKVMFHKEVYAVRADVMLFGKIIAHARGRRSGAEAGNDVTFVSGGVTSGGSSKNWKSIVKEGSVAILSNVNKNIYENSKINSEITAEIIEETANKMTRNVKGGLMDTLTIGDIINSVIAILTLFSVIGVIITIIEMRNDRNAAYKPDVLINPFEKTFEWDKDGWEDWQSFSDLTIKTSTEKKEDGVVVGKITMPIATFSGDSFYNFTVANVGVGTAKNVLFSWDESNTERLSSFLAASDNTKMDFCEIDKSIVFSYDNALLMLDRELPFRVMFMLPAERSEDNYIISFPAQYTILIHEAFKSGCISNSMPENPYLLLNVSYEDLQGKHIEKKIMIFIKQKRRIINDDGSGIATYQLVPHYLNS